MQEINNKVPQTLLRRFVYKYNLFNSGSSPVKCGQGEENEPAATEWLTGGRLPPWCLRTQLIIARALSQPPAKADNTAARQTKTHITASLPPSPGTQSWQFPKERKEKRGGCKQTHVSDRQRKEQGGWSRPGKLSWWFGGISNSLKGRREKED